MRIGAAGNLQQKLNASTDNLNQTFVYASDGSMAAVDTVLNTKNQSGTIELPASYNVGVMFSKSVASSLVSDFQWTIGAEYSASNWANDYRFYGQPDKVINSHMIRVGGQFTPNPLTPKNTWERAIYRAGFYTRKRFCKCRWQ